MPGGAAINPKPREVATQAVVLHDEEGGLAWRGADDATEAGAGVEHQRFIFSCAIGVRWATKLHPSDAA